MIERIRVAPPCPKCGSKETYDIIPELEDDHNVQIDESLLIGLEEYSLGNACYACIACGHKWKKFRGRRPYLDLESFKAYVGGFHGPCYTIGIDFRTGELTWDSEPDSYYEIDVLQNREERVLTESELDWLREGLYKCDVLNWADNYQMFAIMDGTQWNVILDGEAYHEVKQGSNHFPKQWNRFCKLMEKVSTRSFR
ncbi:zinc ribbon domain-containing protein [Exiguobacterium flavidum]|uniref:hypothetical protein n=1 Tax=Exiguobacterium flavidum TaxID=2184695 RepID=UPI000DF75894|nr:hypothetical protein [Exiguobacterium flavidum]